MAASSVGVSGLGARALERPRRSPITTIPACTVAPKSLTNCPRNCSSFFVSTAMGSSKSIYRVKDLFLARIVCGIYIIKLQGRAAVDLHDDFAGGHRVVMHVGIEIGEAAGGK